MKSDQVIKIRELTNKDRVVNYDKQLRRIRMKEARQRGAVAKKFNTIPAKTSSPVYTNRANIRAVTPLNAN